MSENPNSLYDNGVNPANQNPNRVYPVLNTNTFQAAPESAIYNHVGGAGGPYANNQQFRLTEITRIRNELTKSIKQDVRKSKMYKKQVVTTEWMNGALSVISVLTGTSAALSVMPVITIPLAIPMGIVSAVSGVSSGVVLAISRNRRRKFNIVNEGLSEKKTVMAGIINYISKAINDNFITDEEFAHICKLYEGLDHKKTPAISQDNAQLMSEIANLLKNYKK